MKQKGVKKMNTSKHKFLLGAGLIGVTTFSLAIPQGGDTIKRFDGGSGWRGCPMMNSGMGMMNRGMMGMMGPGMMGGAMKGMGMMNRGMMSDWKPWMDEGPWSGLNYGSDGELLEPLSKNQAEGIAGFYLERVDNPRLKLGKITEREKVFDIEVVTKDNSLVDRILVEKDTGWIYPASD